MPRIRTYGLDIDTIRFAQRVKQGSGTTILPEPLKQINKFVVGIKKLGLWNSMICWPMRSIHNAGTGSTVYSLGGQGTFNGTMVNGVEWDYNGALKPATLAFCRIDTPYNLQVEGSSISFFNTLENFTNRGLSHFGQNFNTGIGFPIFFGMGGGQNTFFGQATTPPTVTHNVVFTQNNQLGTYNSHGVSWNPNNASLYYNGINRVLEGVYGTAGHTLQTGASMNNIILLGSFGAVTGNGNTSIWSIILISTKQLTAQQHKLIFDLINKTINANVSTLKNI